MLPQLLLDHPWPFLDDRMVSTESADDRVTGYILSLGDAT